MQGTRDVRSALQLGMFGAVGRHIIDLIIIDFIILGLPMGLTCSPRVFTRVSKFFCDWLRKKGVLIIIYIDVCY